MGCDRDRLIITRNLGPNQTTISKPSAPAKALPKTSTERRCSSEIRIKQLLLNFLLDRIEKLLFQLQVYGSNSQLKVPGAQDVWSESVSLPYQVYVTTEEIPLAELPVPPRLGG